MTSMKNRKLSGNFSDFEDIQTLSKFDELLFEEEQTYVMNGILVESKAETEEDVLKMKQRRVKQYVKSQSIW
jgi:hypothetical protein